MNNYNIKSSFVRKRGNNYNVYIEYIDETGKLKQKSLGKYESKKDAEKHLIDLKSSINNNKYIIPQDITFVERCNIYIHDKGKNFSPLYVKSMENVLRISVEPFFKDVKLNDVNPYMLQSFINEMYLKYSNSTAKTRVALVKSTLSEAYRFKEISENPCDFTKKPNITNTKESKVKEPYDLKEIKDLMEKLEGRFFEVHILLMLTMGLRGEEVCGLKWKDIDFNKNTISINQVLVKVDNKLIFKEPKTKSSYRTITAPDELMVKLKKLKMKHNEYKLQGLLPEGEFEDLVCLSSRLEPMYTFRLWENFKDLCVNHNLRRIRLHDLRHTHATMLVLSGTDFKTISNRLGHGDIKITLNRYSHVLEEMDKKASNNISDILFK